MIIENKDCSCLVWNSKLDKAGYRFTPTLFLLKFNKFSNEIELKTSGIFNMMTLSIEELEDMVEFLKEYNKKHIKSYGGKK